MTYRTTALLLLLLPLMVTPSVAAPADIAQMLHDSVARCWSPPAGASGTVTVHFELQTDGHVVGKPKVNGFASAGVGKAAAHAVTFCQPYRLPPERFPDWQHAVVTLSAGTSD